MAAQLQAGYPASENSHVSRELTKRFVEVVHLGQDADYYDNRKDISTWVRELVVAGESELEGNAEAFDSHDRNTANR